MVKLRMCANIVHMEFGFLHLRKWVTTLRYCTLYEYVKLKEWLS